MKRESQVCPVTGDTVDNSSEWHCEDCERAYQAAICGMLIGPEGEGCGVPAPCPEHAGKTTEQMLWGWVGQFCEALGPGSIGECISSAKELARRFANREPRHPPVIVGPLTLSHHQELAALRGRVASQRQALAGKDREIRELHAQLTPISDSDRREIDRVIREAVGQDVWDKLWGPNLERLCGAVDRLLSRARGEAQRAVPGEPVQGSDLEKERNRTASYRNLWEQSCEAVAELCVLAEAPHDSMHDVWTLKVAIERLLRKRPWTETALHLPSVHRTLVVLFDSLVHEGGTYSAGRIAEELGFGVGDLHSAGLQVIANALFDAREVAEGRERVALGNMTETPRLSEATRIARLVDAAIAVVRAWQSGDGETPNEILLERRIDDLDEALGGVSDTDGKGEGQER